MSTFEYEQTFNGQYGNVTLTINDSLTHEKPIWFVDRSGRTQLNAAFSLTDAKEIRAHLDYLISEVEAARPKLSEQIKALKWGTLFRFNYPVGASVNWFRTIDGATSDSGVTSSTEDFAAWDELSAELVVLYTP